MSTPEPDAFAQFLGIGVTRRGDGRAESRLEIAPQHLNPHGTAHGALLYSLAGVALAAAANDERHSGVVSAVHIDYVRPARLGDALVARAEVAERLPREDLFDIRVVRGPDGELVARAQGRATRRERSPGA
ncbi:MAG TPA: hotdog fold thioesterase [Mycobacteriales bacterium]|nr:thioesterase [Mycobacterium sp.]